MKKKTKSAKKPMKKMAKPMKKAMPAKKKSRPVAKKKTAGRTDAMNNVRSLTKVSGGASYAITLPRDVIKAFKWKERQKLQLKVDAGRKSITIVDWKK